MLDETKSQDRCILTIDSHGSIPRGRNFDPVGEAKHGGFSHHGNGDPKDSLVFFFNVFFWESSSLIKTNYMSKLWKTRKTPLKKDIDTQNDGLEEETPSKNSYFWYLCQFSGV